VDDVNSQSLVYSDNSKRRIAERIVRSSDSSYAYRCKLDVSKYVLASYEKILWRHVVIRFEMEDKGEEQNFYDYCKKLFPLASIYTERSDTAEKYFKHLSMLTEFSNPWIFYCPNNDHPLIASEPYDFKSILSTASTIENCNECSIISIAYSHYTESINIVSRDKKLWGSYSGIYPTKIYEDSSCVAVVLNKFLCDSIQIFRLNSLLELFAKTENFGRVIRLEDTEFYLNENIKHVLIIPKVEICRHFDGYYHNDVWGSIWNSPTPLFIPPGFFEKNIMIRYGYGEYLKGFVNINPAAVNYIFRDKSGADLLCDLEDIPFFWKSRISSVNINEELDKKIAAKGVLKTREAIYDPWQNSIFLNIIQSYIRQIIFPLLFVYQHLRKFIFRMYGHNKFYRLIAILRDKFLMKFIV
jgi:hypothetical protein